MKTRIIQTKFWTDSFILKLSSMERYLFMYYLTNAHVNILHFYECTDELASLETGLPLDFIEKAKLKYSDKSKILFYKDFVFLKNAHKYENFSGNKNEIAKGKLLNELSNDVLDWYKRISDTPINTPLIPSITHNLKDRTNKTENGQSMNEDINPEDVPL